MEGFRGLTLPLTIRCIHTCNLSWEPENKPEVKAALNWQETFILHVCHGAEQPEHQALSKVLHVLLTHRIAFVVVINIS